MNLTKLTLSAGLCLLSLTALPAGGDTIRPVNPEKWGEIETHIRNSWMRYVDNLPSFPKPYSYALNPGTLYYWDNYFINEGLMRQGLMEQARNNIENLTFEIEKLGFVPNASDWGEDRSQTPYYSMMVRSWYDRSGVKDTAWLRRAYNAVLKEYEFWTNTNGNAIEDHSTPVAGLQRYGHHSDSASLVKFYDRVLAGRFHLSKEVPVSEKIRVAGDRLAEAETMDFTPRFDGRCTEFIPVDLNSNLYQYEKDLAFYEKELGIKSKSNWQKRAAQRAALIERYLWNDQRGMFLDYDFVNKRHSEVASVITVMPLYWGFATPKQAERVVANLPLFDSKGGLVVCELSEQKILYQWGDGAVWAPIQLLAMGALDNYGYRDNAKQVALKWLNTVTSNYLDPHPATHRPFKYGDGTRHPGFIYEKYARDGQINDSEYPCSEMMGWTAATFIRALEVVRR